MHKTLILQKWDNILVYGAGAIGAIFLDWITDTNFDMNKITVWDKRYKQLHKVKSFYINEPNFNIDFDRDKTIVVIALHYENNSSIIKELESLFRDNGYKHITTAEEIMCTRKYIDIVDIDNFEDEGYTDFIYQEEIDFSEHLPLVKAIAFYLPQFHEIPENDEWWGAGFTEWTNTKKTKPNFKGHYQPRTPHKSIGYYDLSDVNAIRKQAEISKRHGIYGWCIYHYWFSGRTLLTRPLDLILENKDIDIHFCMLWCNEDWSKRWIGDEKQILIANEYADDDPVRFIDDLKKYMLDERYIKINNKPVIAIYIPQDIPNAKKVIRQWRARANEIGIGEIVILSVKRPKSIKELGLEDSFDGDIDFCPAYYYSEKGVQLRNKEGEILSNNLYYYKNFVENYVKIIEIEKHTSYLSCVCGYDNTPRYGKKSTVFNLGFSLHTFYDLVRYITNEAVDYNKEFIFVFAWNEWAESAYLEPDERFGYAMLNTFSKAIRGLPYNAT